jgi:hypothetical protein
MGDYVSLSVTGTPANRLLLLAPGAAPVTLASLGGAGGNGGAGYNGRDGWIDYNTGFVTPPEQGGDGAQGGAGGAGGNITVISNGLDVSKFLSFDTRGGPGGQGGLPGRGGRGAVLPAGGRWPAAGYGYATADAPPGRPGAPGPPGPDGQIFIR